MLLEELFAGQNFDVKAAMAHLAKVAEELGLAFAARAMTYSSRKAQEMGKWAEDQGRGEEFHLAAFRAYFAQGLNLYQEDVLQEVARQAGLEPANALAALKSRAYAQAVDADWGYSRKRGIRAVPTFSLEGRSLVGAQPYERLASLARGQNAGAALTIQS